MLITFTQYNTGLYNLRLAVGTKMLQSTGLHPLYSVTRGDWVRLGELKAGEHFRRGGERAGHNAGVFDLVLIQNEGGGRSTSYAMAEHPSNGAKSGDSAA